MEISFPNLVMPKVTAMGTISFQTLVDGEYIWCEISCEALRDHFGAHSMDGNDLLYSFHMSKEEILQTARNYLELNGGRPVLLMAVNFK
ncbi:DUF1488 domain-containing protein [Solimicrobium silvestre]|uniref:DUF1488 domain-containing protein n=1 Tax=Solimicrobium silvestre TaxID=2099400 RepID=A0A2S9GU32_9BURK|nr:DUF1488 domain-containing protein [Solimicrobium silvestre]PRC91218.1 hypothetical protein S2091_4113 [Solimicrobium silvestre]